MESGPYKPGTLITLMRPSALRTESPATQPPPVAPPTPPVAPVVSSLRVQTPPGALLRSEGQRLLLGVRETLREIAKRLGANVSVQAVSHWRRGEALPAPSFRILLQTVYGIPVESWGLTPIDPDAPAKTQRMPTEHARLTATTPNTTEDCIALLELIRRDRAEAGQTMLPAERMKLVDAEAKVLALLARLEKENELREDRYVRQHPVWQRARAAIVAALAPHPVAAKAVIEALQKLDM